MKTKLLIATLAAAFAVQAQADTISIKDTGGLQVTSSSTENHISIGTGSSTQMHGVAIGGGATSMGGSTTDKQGGVVIGNNARIDTSADDNSAGNVVVIGAAAQSTFQGGTSVGANTFTTKIDSTAVGVLSEAHGARSTAIGTYATVLADGNNSTALGYRSSVTKADVQGGTAAFTGTTVADTHGVVSVGQSADATAALNASDAIHNGNGTTPAAYKATFDRRIINVQDGVKETDAVNVRQVTKVQTDLQNQITALSAGSGSMGTRVGNLENQVAALGARLDDVSKTAEAGAALGLATAGLVAPPVGQSGVMVGTGFFRGSTAVAVGYAFTGTGWGFKASASAAGNKNFGGSISGGIFW